MRREGAKFRSWAGALCAYLPAAPETGAWTFCKLESTQSQRDSARGCARRAALGDAAHYYPQPQRGCTTVPSSACYNPVGVDETLPDSPRVASQTRQPWAQ